MTHQHTEARNHYPYKARDPYNSQNLTHVLWNPRVPWNPCWRALTYRQIC